MLSSRFRGFGELVIFWVSILTYRFYLIFKLCLKAELYVKKMVSY